MNARQLAIAAVLFATLSAGPVLADGGTDHLSEGRAIAGAFGAELRQALQVAMAEGGPLAAIGVCNEQAPAIAHAAAAASGASVGRTALKLRNPGNAPDEHERAVLESLAAAVAATKGEGAPPERLDTLPDGRVRYMRAIVTEAPCLACHGESLAPEVAEAIDALYPEDQARGFSVGQLRGAFTITWPAGE
jgi:hypothetical protein